MKAVLFLAVIFIAGNCSAQKEFSKDSIDSWLNKIDNNTVTASGHYFLLAGMSRETAALYTHANRYIIQKLIALLDDANKTLVSHVLLTKLLEPGNKAAYRTSEDLTETIVFLYRYNGFSWKEIFGKTNLTTEIQVDAEEIKKIKLYWITRKENTLNSSRN